jgi:hypothetical protein
VDLVARHQEDLDRHRPIGDIRRLLTLFARRADLTKKDEKRALNRNAYECTIC